MGRRVYIHVGLPKTGTTYLQHALWTHRDDLAERGLLLPGPHRRRHLLASLEVREDPKLARRKGDVKAPWRSLVRECRRWPGDVVISHEFFGAASPEQVRRIVDDLAGFDVHVVVTARPMTDLGISRWQEWVKSGGKMGVDAYPQRKAYDPVDEWGWGSFDLADMLQRWGSVVPHRRIHVLPLDPANSAQDLWRRFAAVLGVDVEDLPAPDAPANRSLGVAEVELLRRVNRELTDFSSAADRGNWIRGYLAEGGVLPPGRERFRAGREKRGELARRGRRAVEILRSGDYDVCGDIGLLEPADPDDPAVAGLRHPEDVSDSELLDVAIVTVANLLRGVRSVSHERDDALRERDHLARRCAELEGGVVRLSASVALRAARRLTDALARRRGSGSRQRHHEGTTR